MSERFLGLSVFRNDGCKPALTGFGRKGRNWFSFGMRPERVDASECAGAPLNRHLERIETALTRQSVAPAGQPGRDGGRNRSAMLNVELISVKALLLGVGLACSAAVSGALAFDINAGVNKESGPFDLFKFGFKAYKSGQKQEAVEAYRYAAEKGHTGSRWALANMYAYGDGVAKSDFEAFKIYNEIAGKGIEPGSEDTGFFVNALMALAEYYKHGIENSPVKADLGQARQLYFQAASAFGVPEAQFQLARMMLRGEGGSRNVEQAKKWLNRARKNGHIGAMSVFGSLLFQEGQTARGLGYMTAALDHCSTKDRPWIQDLQEQAFSVATEDDRRAAIAMAQQISGTLPTDDHSADSAAPVPEAAVPTGSESEVLTLEGPVDDSVSATMAAPEQ